MKKKIRTRFAPSPTGFLHIGGARTALFNWLFARHHQGDFLLRIEDTDQVRSTEEATQAIFSSLRWLGLMWDEEPIFQLSRIERHKHVVEHLLQEGHAYHCRATPDKPAIRFKARKEGEISFTDHVMGTITVACDTLDDLVLLRSDGTPTYNLAVVVDDHDMDITHVIRGSDHISNTPRQIQIYQALGWSVPEFAHVPMILGHDGTKLSKRHGALSTQAYESMGYLPEALKNYLTRLGWAHGDAEIFSMAEAITWFSLEGIGRSPAQFDQQKLDHMNGYYIRHLAPDILLKKILEKTGQNLYAEKLKVILSSAAERAKTLVELVDLVSFLWMKRPLTYPEPVLDEEIALTPLLVMLRECSEWTESVIESAIQAFLIRADKKLKNLAPVLRMALTARKISPPLFTVMVALGRDEVLLRIEDYMQTRYHEASRS